MQMDNIKWLTISGIIIFILVHPKIAKFTPPFLINNNNLTSLLFFFILFFLLSIITNHTDEGHYKNTNINIFIIYIVQK